MRGRQVRCNAVRLGAFLSAGTCPGARSSRQRAQRRAQANTDGPLRPLDTKNLRDGCVFEPGKLCKGDEEFPIPEENQKAMPRDVRDFSFQSGGSRLLGFHLLGFRMRFRILAISCPELSLATAMFHHGLLCEASKQVLRTCERAVPLPLRLNLAKQPLAESVLLGFSQLRGLIESFLENFSHDRSILRL